MMEKAIELFGSVTLLFVKFFTPNYDFSFLPVYNQE